MNIEEIIEENAHHFLQGIRTEYNGDKEAAVIIQKYLKGDEIRDDEEHLLKTVYPAPST